MKNVFYKQKKIFLISFVLFLVFFINGTEASDNVIIISGKYIKKSRKIKKEVNIDGIFIKVKKINNTLFSKVGMLPIRVNIKNNRSSKVLIDYTQFEGKIGNFTVKAYNPEKVYESLYLVLKKEKEEEIGQGAIYGALSGALIGSAVSDVYDVDPSPSVKIGAASGFLSGAAYSERKIEAEIHEMLNKLIKKDSLIHEEIASGGEITKIIFFPVGIKELFFKIGAQKYEVNF